METKFNFKSSVCTSREQSERLLALGFKKETADMALILNESDKTYFARPRDYVCAEASTSIPAWSLGRLLALGNGEDWWNAEITLKDEKYGIHTGFDTTWYDDIFEAVIAWIEEDIKEGYFNKEYLEEE